MNKKRLFDKELSIVSGGLLIDGWQDTVYKMMELHKAKFGDKAKQKVKDTMSLALNDPTSKVDEHDLEIIYKYIDEYWDKV